MKPFVVSLLLLVSLLMSAQTSDVKWFDSKWDPLPSKSGAAYYRATVKDSASDHFYVQDYTVSGKLHRTASYISLKPEIRDGKFLWYYANGQVQKEAVYEGNKVISWKVLNKKGEQELSALINFKGNNGEELTEPMKVDKEPSFVGGKKAMSAYERKNLKYPPVTAIEPLEGYVMIYFLVREDGTLTDFKLVKSLHPDLDKEAVRYVSSMPNWTPALVGEVPVAVPFVLPIYFYNKSAHSYTRNNMDAQ